VRTVKKNFSAKIVKLYTIMGVSEECATRIYLPRKERLLFQFPAISSSLITVQEPPSPTQDVWLRQSALVVCLSLFPSKRVMIMWNISM